jgi:hypothetical protein
MKMKAIRSFETSGKSHPTKQRARSFSSTNVTIFNAAGSVKFTGSEPM